MNIETPFDSDQSGKPTRRKQDVADDPIRLDPDSAEDQSDDVEDDELQLDESDVIDESIGRRDLRAPKLAWPEQRPKLPLPEEQTKLGDSTPAPETEPRTEFHVKSDSESADYLAEAVESAGLSTSEVATNPTASDDQQEHTEMADTHGVSDEKISDATNRDEPDSDDDLKLSEPDAVARPVEPNRPKALPSPEQDRDEIQRKIEPRRVQQLSMLDILGLTTLVALTLAAARYVPLGIYMLLLGLVIVTLTMTFAFNRNRKPRAFVLLAFAMLILFYCSAIVRFFWSN